MGETIFAMAEGAKELQQSGLNASWFSRYDHMCSKYKKKSSRSEPEEVDDTAGVTTTRGKRRGRGSGGGFLPSIGVPEEVQRVVQKANNSKGDYNAPCSLRTYQARLGRTIAPAQDPYEPEVRKLAKLTGMSARKVEDLRQIYLEHSRGRKKIDILGYRKLLAYFGVVSKTCQTVCSRSTIHCETRRTNSRIFSRLLLCLNKARGLIKLRCCLR